MISYNELEAKLFSQMSYYFPTWDMRILSQDDNEASAAVLVMRQIGVPDIEALTIQVTVWHDGSTKYIVADCCNVDFLIPGEEGFGRTYGTHVNYVEVDASYPTLHDMRKYNYKITPGISLNCGQIDLRKFTDVDRAVAAIGTYVLSNATQIVIDIEKIRYTWHRVTDIAYKLGIFNEYEIQRRINACRLGGEITDNRYTVELEIRFTSADRCVVEFFADTEYMSNGHMGPQIRYCKQGELPSVLDKIQSYIDYIVKHAED